MEWSRVSPAEPLSEVTPADNGPHPGLESAATSPTHRLTQIPSNGSRPLFKKRSLPGPPPSRASLSPDVRRRMSVVTVAPTLSQPSDHGGLHPHRMTMNLAQPMNQLRAQPRLIHSGSIGDHVSEEYARTLQVLFKVCDLDEDGKLTPAELDVMLQLVGLSAAESHTFIGQRFPTTDLADLQSKTLASIGLSFDQVVHECQDYILRCAAHSPLPSNTFLVRCKPLKLGFRKCDSDGNGFVTHNELEIALQKLEFSLSDAQLAQLVAILDRNDDGKIEWSDFVLVAWTNALAAMSATLADDFLTIDIFADLPLLLRPASLVASASAASGLAGTRPVEAQTQAFKFRRNSSFSSPRTSQIEPRLSSRAKSSINIVASTAESSSASGATKSRMERMGVDFLMRVSMKRVAQSKRKNLAAISPGESLSRQGTMSFGRSNSFSGMAPSTMAAASGGNSIRSRRTGTRRNGFSPAVRRRIQQIEAVAILLGLLAGILSGLMSIWFEGMIPSNFEERHGTYMYYLCVIIINIGVSLVEVNAMYVTAVICAFQLTVCTNLTLYPQDAEREFLTRAIARAALQVGYRTDRIFGIDPMRGSPRVVLALSFVVYKSKRYMLKFLLKLFIKRVLWRAVAKSVLSLLVLPINGVMNAWTLNNVMRNCRVSIIGPPCALAVLELFFLDDDGFTPHERVDYVRVMGCAFVCKRSVHPNLEIMLDHMRHRWLRPEMWPISESCSCCSVPASHEPCVAHPLDDTARFVDSIALYTQQHQQQETAPRHVRNIVFLLLVALVIDGNLDWVERRLYLRVCAAARLQRRWGGVLQLKDDFVAGKGVHIDAVYALVVVQDAAQQQSGAGLSLRESLRYLWSRFSRLLS